MIHKIAIPLMCFSIFSFYFSDFIVKGSRLIESISHPVSDYLNVIQGILKWQNVIPYCGHFWYLYTYILIVAALPSLFGFHYLIDSKAKSNTMLMIIFILFLINDFTNNHLFFFSHHSINSVIPAGMMILFGHIVYRNISNIKVNRTAFVYGVSLFSFALILRFASQYYFYSMGYGNHPLYWYTSFGLLSCTGLAFVSIGFKNIIAKSSTLSYGIQCLGRLTFYIYIFHMLIIGWCSRLKILPRIYASFNRMRFNTLLGNLFTALTVFLVSLLIVLIYIAIEKGVKELCLRIVKDQYRERGF